MKRTLTAWVLAAFVAWALPADAGEGLITKVRGRTLAIDKGAADGLEVGLEVTVVRPPDEAIIHPLTGENLGAPEIEIASGRINKVSARAASVQLDGNPIISVRPGDMARFLTIEEKMVMEQEVATETAEQAIWSPHKPPKRSSRKPALRVLQWPLLATTVMWAVAASMPRWPSNTTWSPGQSPVGAIGPRPPVRMPRSGKLCNRLRCALQSRLHRGLLWSWT